MSNSYFRFKEFTVHQDRCAMKVSTDACIQGAWTPLPAGDIRVLDIGAGTGLLSLMLAQRYPQAVIDAVEIDEAAAAQAAENIAGSSFSGRITVHHADARIFMPGCQYDVIICNPPFFRSSLLGPDAMRNAARHDLHLHQKDLLSIFARLLLPGGYASLLWPVAEMTRWDQTATTGFGWTRRSTLHVRDNDSAGIHRQISLYGRGPEPAADTFLSIKNVSGGDYSEAFKDLLAPFYLSL